MVTTPITTYTQTTSKENIEFSSDSFILLPKMTSLKRCFPSPKPYSAGSTHTVTVCVVFTSSIFRHKWRGTRTQEERNIWGKFVPESLFLHTSQYVYVLVTPLCHNKFTKNTPTRPVECEFIVYN